MLITHQYKKKTLLISLLLSFYIFSANCYSEDVPDISRQGVNNIDKQDTTNKLLPFLASKTPAPVGKNESAAPMDALSVSLGLIFILLLIFFLAWIMRKAGYSHLSGQGYLTILATLNFGQKEKIALIKVGRQQILVGITATQINTLHVLDKPLDIKERQARAENNQFAAKFYEVLNPSSSSVKNKPE
ncbi:MAG: flagellar biosynthetic protein FliO [gamma proteobacterium symbiont of Taylorina sp.]|nr:flagellar biosynthetic protein FliO [gamma proteobacterium symbiont of Taylorina sp.]